MSDATEAYRVEEPASPAGGEGGGQEKPRALWKELPILVVIAVGLALLIKTFFLQAFFIPSASMEKTLHGCPGCRGDRVLVNKLVYDFRNPHRGEIVVFSGSFTDQVTGGMFPPETDTAQPSNAVGRAVQSVTSFLGLGSGSDSDFIKRVVGVGGDTVSCPPSAADPTKCTHVLVNGKAIDESAYLYESNGTYISPFQQQPFAARVVPPGRLFVMGDHRDDSDDSRPTATNATVPVDKVIGRAFVVVWPPKRFGSLPVPKAFDQPLNAAANSVVTPPITGALIALPVVGVRRRRRRRRTPSS